MSSVLKDAAKARGQIAEENRIFETERRLDSYIQEISAITNKFDGPFNKILLTADKIEFQFKSFPCAIPSETSVDIVVSLGLPIAADQEAAWVHVEYFGANHKPTEKPRVEKSFVLREKSIAILETGESQYTSLESSNLHGADYLDYVNEAIGLVADSLKIPRSSRP